MSPPPSRGTDAEPCLHFVKGPGLGVWWVADSPPRVLALELFLNGNPIPTPTPPVLSHPLQKDNRNRVTATSSTDAW